MKKPMNHLNPDIRMAVLVLALYDHVDAIENYKLGDRPNWSEITSKRQKLPAEAKKLYDKYTNALQGRTTTDIAKMLEGVFLPYLFDGVI